MMKFKLNPICKKCEKGEQEDNFFLCRNTAISFDFNDPSYYAAEPGDTDGWIQNDLSKYCPQYNKLILIYKLKQL